MGILFRSGNWWIRVNGDEHPPVHCHVIHPDGDALIYLSGKTLSRRVPQGVMQTAWAWVVQHEEDVRKEWSRLND